MSIQSQKVRDTTLDNRLLQSARTKFAKCLELVDQFISVTGVTLVLGPPEYGESSKVVSRERVKNLNAN